MPQGTKSKIEIYSVQEIATLMQDVVHHFGSIAKNMNIRTRHQDYAWSRECRHLRTRLDHYASGCAKWIRAQEMAATDSRGTLSESPLIDADVIENETQLASQIQEALSCIKVFEKMLNIDSHTGYVL